MDEHRHSLLIHAVLCPDPCNEEGERLGCGSTYMGFADMLLIRGHILTQET